MLNKIKTFISDYRKKRFIRKELAKKYKYIFGKLNLTNSISREKRIEELTEGIFYASKIVKKQVDEQKMVVSNHSKEALLNRLKSIIDNHYGEIDRENQELKMKLKKSVSTANKYREQSEKIKKTIKKV